MKNVAPNSNGVEAVVAEGIRAALERQEKGKALIAEGRKEWAEATYSLALSLAEAREWFRANQEFSDWLASEGIDIPKDDRAALIAMGCDPGRALKVLNETTKTSVRRIFNEEFRLRTPANTNAAKDAAGMSKARASEPASEQTIGETPSSEANPAEKVDINPSLAAEVLALRKENTALAKELDRLRLKFDDEVQKRVEAYTKGAHGNDVAKALKRAQQTNSAVYPLTEGEMKVLVRACHPDAAGNVNARTEAMALLNLKRDALIGPPKIKGPEREYVPPVWPSASEGLAGLFAKADAKEREEAELRRAARKAVRH